MINKFLTPGLDESAMIIFEMLISEVVINRITAFCNSPHDIKR